MSRLTPDQRTMLATWQQHAHAEFVLKDTEAALATMTENPYVFLVSSGTARVGRAAVRDFYANHFLPQIPPDLEITSLSQTFDNDRIAEEMVNPLHPHDRYGLDSSRCATYGSKSRVRGSCDHPVPRRQSGQRASLLGSGHVAVPDGHPGSSFGGGRSRQCGPTPEIPLIRGNTNWPQAAAICFGKTMTVY